MKESILIDKNRARIVYTVKSKKIVNSLKEMLSEYNFKIKKDNSYYRLYIENKKNYYKSNTRGRTERR